MIKRRKILKIFLLMSIFTIFPMSVYAEDIYDVVLFWGQSNMRGASGEADCENKVDENFGTTSNEIQTFSDLTDIHPFILKYYKTIDYVAVPFKSNTAYEYVWLGTNNHLKAFTSSTKTVGESVYATKKNGKISFSTKGSKDETFKQSAGTNISLWFSKTYYERTGHKVIVVMAARNGLKINKFLPSTHPNYDDTKNRYLYEAITSKYKAAIAYLEKNNYKIGNRFDIVFQGESDVSSTGGIDEEYWAKMYQEVHKNLKNDLKLDFSAIIYTAGKNGYNPSKIESVHKSQEKAINRNSDVILGSDYVYKHFVPDGSDPEVIAKANLSTAAQCDNGVHYNAAALSQIGYETANNVSNYLLRTLTYNVNGGSTCSNNRETRTKNSKWNNLCTPTRSGYIFTGWNTKKDGTGKTITNDTVVDSNVTVYAQWKSNTIKVTFDCSGGTGGGVQSFKYGVKGQKFAQKCTRKGYTFKKWSKSIIGGDGSYKLDCPVSDSWILTNSPAVTVYAIWTKDASRAGEFDDVDLNTVIEEKSNSSQILYVVMPIVFVIALLVTKLFVDSNPYKKGSRKTKKTKKTKKSKKRKS